MCGITKLECLVCRAQEHYVFHPCGSFIRECENDWDKSFIPGRRFHCDSIRWPIDPYVNKTFAICDKCFVAGQKYFNASSEMEASVKKRKRTFRAAMDIPVDDTDDKESDSGSNSNSAKNKTDNTIENERLPVVFHDLSDRDKNNLLREYKNYSGAHNLRLQSMGGGNRFLSLWVPRCPICQQPTVTEDYESVADLEFEPDGPFWAWLHNRKDQPTPMVQTSVATGFMQKVCDTCIVRESRTRGLVNSFLKRSPHWGHKWLIVTWLQSRGLDLVPFHEHSTLNVGVPDRKPPSTRDIMRLMTLSWTRATGGLTFGDAATGDTSRAPLVRHPFLFVSFSQWQDLCDPLSDKERPPLKFHLPVEQDSGLLAKSDLAQAVAEVLEQEGEDKRKEMEQEEEAQGDGQHHESGEGNGPEGGEHEELDKIDPTAIGPFAKTEQYTVLRKDFSDKMTVAKIWTLVDSGAIDAFVALRLKLALRLWYIHQSIRVHNKKPTELMPQEQEALQDAHDVLDRIIGYVDDINRQAATTPPLYSNATDGWAKRHVHLKPKGGREVISKQKMSATMKTVERYLKATGATVAGFTSVPLESMPLEAVRSSKKPYGDLHIDLSRPVFICSPQDEADHRDEKEAACHVQWLRPGRPDSRQLQAPAMQFTCIAMPTTYWKKMVRIGTVEEAMLDRPLPTPDEAEIQRREEQAQVYQNIASALM